MFPATIYNTFVAFLLYTINFFFVLQKKKKKKKKLYRGAGYVRVYTYIYSQERIERPSYTLLLVSFYALLVQYMQCTSCVDTGPGQSASYNSTVGYYIYLIQMYSH